MKKTLATLNDMKPGGEIVRLPNPELYILINGIPTKNNVVWRSLVNVKAVKTAVQKLREINWLYKDVSDSMIDDSVRQVIEVVHKHLAKCWKECVSVSERY